MADITNLTGYTWKANDEIYFTMLTANYNINFKCNGTSYTQLRIENIIEEEIFNKLYYDDIEVYDDLNNVWKDETFKTIQIIDGDDVSNTFLISLLSNNGSLTKSTCNFKLGDEAVDKICLGGYEVDKIYLGTNLVYEK